MSVDYNATQSYNRRNNPATLIVLGKTQNGIKTFQLNGTMTLGRESGDIVIPNSIVSSNHGKFEVWGNRCVYTDTKSLNGTFINGVALRRNPSSGEGSCELFDGDVLRIDNPELNHPHPDAVTMIYTTEFEESSRWMQYPITTNTVINIGRNHDSGINIQRPYISRDQAVIFERYGHLYIQNHSNGGVLLNNRPVNGTCELFKRNVLRIYDTIFFVLDGFLLYNTTLASRSGLIIDIKETAVNDGLKRKVLLSNVHVEIAGGDFALILGGSGAGKSTFVNSALGKYKIAGSVRFADDNGSGGEKHANAIAYVPQTLPLRKTERLIDVITDTAILRMNGKKTKEERNSFIDETLNSLGLFGKKKTLIKNLSGGEQRRAAIANEAVTNPDIFFLDEPDSGLDPESGMELMGMLKALSKKGKMVLLISHNYASYPHPEKIYTKIIVLAKSDKDNVGKLAFCGSVPDALRFFGVSELREITKLINPKTENGQGRADEFVEKFRRMNGV